MDEEITLFPFQAHTEAKTNYNATYTYWNLFRAPWHIDNTEATFEGLRNISGLTVLSF